MGLFGQFYTFWRFRHQRPLTRREAPLRRSWHALVVLLCTSLIMAVLEETEEASGELFVLKGALEN